MQPEKHAMSTTGNGVRLTRTKCASTAETAGNAERRVKLLNQARLHMPTSKQRKFALGIIEGLNPSEAYKAAGYSADNPATVATEAKRLLENPHISPIIQAGKKQAMVDAVWSRKVAIERAQAVQDRAYNQLMNDDNFNPQIYRAWAESADMLNRLANVDFELQLEREAVRDECAEVSAPMFEPLDQVRPAIKGAEKLNVFYEMKGL
jgi:hypothetical protein